MPPEDNDALVELKIMCVHGLGDHRESTWKADWEKAIVSCFPESDRLKLEFVFVSYDHIFADTNISASEAVSAVWKLTRSGVGSLFRGRRGFFSDVSDRIKWTAGYVVAWLDDEGFKKKTRKLILDALVKEKPNFVLAHSLGSLITYNAFTHRDAADPAVQAILSNANYVTLGSQLGNPFVVRNLTPGRLDQVSARHWYHLFNKHDNVFTSPIRLWNATNFTQIQTHFDIDGIADHAAHEYLAHQNTIEEIWQPAFNGSLRRAFAPPPPPKTKAKAKQIKMKARKALLVGINDYPNESDRLEGCVNDVYEMSAVLQEYGFPPDSIRVCLNDRATAAGILERLEWLLDSPTPDSELVFYYSGHGAQIPEYGLDNEPDRYTETLVPYDFDWSTETAVTDDQIYSLYSQLPYDTRLAMIFDCCHSGGIHRDGGMRVRGLTPPDDIRHRSIQWNPGKQMWEQRGYKPLNDSFSSDGKVLTEFFGENGATTKLGRASIVRGMTEKDYESRKAEDGEAGNLGPYLPLIIEACQESQYSYEYRHGVTSYGAFTFALKTRLRMAKTKITFEELVTDVSGVLAELGFDQLPQVLGPEEVRRSAIPWKL